MVEEARVNQTPRPVEESPPEIKKIPTIEQLRAMLVELDRRISALEESQR